MPLANGINNPVGGSGEANTVRAFGPLNGGRLTIPVTGLALNAQTPAVRVPAGFTLLRCGVNMSDMDTNATPTIVFSLGDAGNAARVFSGFAGAQTGTPNPAVTLTVAANDALGQPTAGFGYRFPVETTLFLTATAAAATGVAGTANIVLEGVID